MNAATAQALAPLATELASVLAAKAELETTERDLKARIRELAPTPGTYEAGGVKLAITPNRRFSVDAAETLLPPEVLAAIRTTRVDPAKAKALLPPQVYEQCLADIGDVRVGLAR